MKAFEVKIQSSRYASHHSGESYGDWSEEYTNFFKSIKLTSDHPDVTSSLDINKYDDVFVLWAEWSTGDSFGNSSRGCTETLGVFKSKRCAEELRDALTKFSPNVNSSDWSGKYSFKSETSDGQKFSIGYVPWCGYFESLDALNIEETTVL